MVKGVGGYYEREVMETKVLGIFTWNYGRRPLSSCLKEMLLGSIVGACEECVCFLNRYIRSFFL